MKNTRSLQLGLSFWIMAFVALALFQYQTEAQIGHYTPIYNYLTWTVNAQTGTAQGTPNPTITLRPTATNIPAITPVSPLAPRQTTPGDLYLPIISI